MNRRFVASRSIPFKFTCAILRGESARPAGQRDRQPRCRVRSPAFTIHETETVASARLGQCPWGLNTLRGSL